MYTSGHSDVAKKDNFPKPFEQSIQPEKNFQKSSKILKSTSIPSKQ